jgi:hypothetical protein
MWREGRIMVCWGYPVHLQKMQASNFGDRRDHFSGYAQTLANMVHGNLVGYYTKKWSQRHGVATGVGIEKLYNRMDMASQDSYGNG